jgi:hypothetical protein
MKLIKILPFVTFALLPFSTFAQVSMFSSNPLKKKQFVFFNQTQYFEKTSKYDWSAKDFNKLSDALKVNSTSLLPMIGYGINDKLSAFMQYPLYWDTQNGSTNFYQGDMVLMSRYAIIPSSSSKTGLTLIGALRIPTADYQNNPYADGSLDFIVGEIFSTKWIGNFRTHLKSEFYINTKNKLGENPGEELRVFLKQDYRINKELKFYINNIYTYQAKKKNEYDILVDNSQTHRILHIFGAEYSINNTFVIKPKVQIPSYGMGGSLFNSKLILDFVYYL